MTLYTIKLSQLHPHDKLIQVWNKLNLKIKHSASFTHNKSTNYLIPETERIWYFIYEKFEKAMHLKRSLEFSLLNTWNLAILSCETEEDHFKNSIHTLPVPETSIERVYIYRKICSLWTIEMSRKTDFGLQLMIRNQTGNDTSSSNNVAKF